MPFSRWFGGGDGGGQRVALVVDGPNILRDEFDVDLAALRAAAGETGQVALARLYLDEHASPGLIRAGEAHGFEVVVTSGDVDVRLAIDAMAMLAEGDWDVLAVASRDLDFKPLLERAAAVGVHTVVIVPDAGDRSAGLVQAAAEIVVVEA